MSTPINIKGVIAATGLKLVARVNLTSAVSGVILSATATPAFTTVTLGSVDKLYLPLTESPAGSGQYGVRGTAAGTTLADTTTEPVTAEVRSVASGTDMTSHAAILTAFEASTTVKAPEQVPDTFAGGFLKSGVWGWVSVGGTVDTVTDDVTVVGPSYVTISPGYANGSITIRRGDSYGATSGQRITITKPTGANWPSDLASLPWTVTFTASKIDKGDGTASSTIGPITCTVNSATSVDVPLTAAQTALVRHLRPTDDARGWEWDLQASNGSLRNTLVGGLLTLLPEITTS